jgi:nicotinamidase-related amidase
MTTELPRKAALVIIDVQRGFDDPRMGRRNNPQAEQNIRKLLNCWRATNRPIFHVKHMSRNPRSVFRKGKPGNAIKKEVWPRGSEPVIKKSVNSAFIGTDLEERLRRKGIWTVVITGLTTDHCVSTSARMAGNLGFRTIVVADGTATFDRTGYDGKKYTARQMHEAELASLNGEFAEVLDTRSILKRASVKS